MIAVLAALLLSATPFAQDNASQPLPEETPVAAPATPATLTVDTPIEMLVANAKAKAVLEAAIPGITTHPAYDQFKGMSLTQVQPMSNGQLTDAQIAQVRTGLAGIK
jgi:hypothetical protein